MVCAGENMHRIRVTRATMLLSIFVAASAFGQEPMTRESLPVRQGRIRFAVVLGRLSAFGQFVEGSWTATTNDARANVQESMTVHAEDGLPAVHYQRYSPDRSLKIHIWPSGNVSILRVPRGESSVVRMQFEQPVRGPVELTVDSDKAGTRVSASNLWALLMTNRELCRTHLIPELNLLRLDWMLEETAHSIKEGLFRLDRDGVAPKRNQWPRLVSDLGSSQFTRRRTAERELRRHGPAALVYLGGLDRSRLDAEQRMRVRRLLNSLSVASDDIPDQVVTWVFEDASVWLHLLTSPSLERREAAVRQLSQIVGAPVEFDSNALEPERRAQIERLSEQLQLGPSVVEQAMREKRLR